jgi:hypothetical protein
MLKRSIAILAVVLLSTALLLAHGDPLVGTVTAISGDKITVKTPAGTLTDVMITKDTWFLKDGKKATRVDLKVNSRVTIDTVKDATTKLLDAESIGIGVTTPAASANAAPKAGATASKTTAKAPPATSNATGTKQ